MDTTPYNQPTASPTTKVTAAGVGGALSIVLVWIAGEFGISMPEEVASAFTTIIAFLSGYFVRDRRPDAVVETIKSFGGNK